MRTIRTITTLTVASLTAPGAVWAAQAPLNYLPPFTTAEYCARHVQANSYPVPKDFVDGQWHGIVAASDGKTYFSVSSHSPDHSGQFYRFDPARGRVEQLIDLAAWCGQPESVGKWNAQGKIHSQIFEIDGKLYATTTPAHLELDRPYAGGHFLAYDLATGNFENLGLFPDARGGLLTMLHEPLRRRLYAISQGDQTLCYYDLETGAIVTIGPCQQNPMQTRTLISDEQGNVYGCDWGHRLWRYRPADNQIELLPTRLPSDPQAPQPDGSRPDSLAWLSTQWKKPVWDPQSQWWYAVLGNDEYLFRFRPPAAGSSDAQVEGLAPFGFRPSQEQPRFASLGLTRRGRELFYCSYPLWRPMAHLMRYHLDTGEVTNLGPIVVDGQRRVAEIHSLELGADNKLHAVAMTWSLDNGRDPAKPWANRAQCYFHARFAVIDPDTDFEPGSKLAAAPAIIPEQHQIAPGVTADVYLPPARPAGTISPALVLIHGGGWGAGTPELLAPHARHFAGQGIVAVNLGYRLTKQEGVRVGDCVADLKTAVRWVRQQADKLGVDPTRIAVAGDSAGGHLAAGTGLLPGFEPAAAGSSRADALILFNPVIDTASADGWKMAGYSDEERHALSPAHHVAPGAPPTLVIHGDADTVVPFAWSERFVAAMQAAGNDITLVRLPGSRHAFIIPGYGRHPEIDAALAHSEDFLRRLGYLP